MTILVAHDNPENTFTQSGGKAMSSVTHTSQVSRLKSRRNAEAEYRVIFGLSLPFFFIAVLLARAFRLIQSPLSSPETSGKTLVQEARDQANSTLPYAFMG